MHPVYVKVLEKYSRTSIVRVTIEVSFRPNRCSVVKVVFMLGTEIG
jgi:hypothetical protein